jgi:hypothetical protein
LREKAITFEKASREPVENLTPILKKKHPFSNKDLQSTYNK